MKKAVWVWSVSLGILCSSFVASAALLPQTPVSVSSLYGQHYRVKAAKPKQMALQYLRENKIKLGLRRGTSDLRFDHVTETPGGFHVRFHQVAGKLPVAGAEIVVTVTRTHEVNFVISAYQPEARPFSGRLQISLDAAVGKALEYLQREGHPTALSAKSASYVLAVTSNESRPQIRVLATTQGASSRDWEFRVDAITGEVVSAEIRTLFAESVDVPATVFDPDPISKTAQSYGSGGFLDSNDGNSPDLAAALAPVALHVEKTDAGYFLKSPYAEVVDFESPADGLFSQLAPDFRFTRDQPAFEAVNAFYHIDQSMRYINNVLGFSVTPRQYAGGVQFDPHALAGDDNSYFSPMTGRLAYGQGGVDDAEDFHVVLHELGHGIHDWITHGQLSREGLSEGSGDYWAVSYGRSVSQWKPTDKEYNWVFIWDGHNPFWPGRVTNTTAHYPEDLVYQVHTDGQMWSSTLLAIWDEVGREVTDRIFLEGLAHLNSSARQSDAALAVLAADEALYAGAHLEVIKKHFVSRGYPVQ